MSTPESTVFDLAEFHERCGGRGAVVAIYEELLEDLELDELVKVGASYPGDVIELAAALALEAGHERLALALRESRPKTALGA